MAAFVRIREPGEYTVRVLYHNEVTITDQDGVSGLIVFESEPFRLKVVKQPKRVVELRPGDREKAPAAVVPSLDEKGPVRIVADEYGPDDHEFVPPTSPAGQLQELG